MAITQDRIIRVIRAGKDMQACLNQLKDSIKIELEIISREPERLAECLSNIFGLCEAIQPNRELLFYLEKQEMWFQMVGRRNASEAARQRRRRQRKKLTAEFRPKFMGGANYTTGVLDAPLDNPLEEALRTAHPAELAEFKQGHQAITEDGVKTYEATNSKTGETITRSVKTKSDPDAPRDPNAPPDAAELPEGNERGLF